MTPSRHADLKQRFIEGRSAFSSEWETLLHLDPDMFEQYVAIRDVPHRKTYLSPKEQEFIYIAVHACATTVYSAGVREHIKAALSVGATKEEIMEVIGLTSLVGVHTVTHGAPILLEVLKEEGMDSKLPPIENDEVREQIKEEFIEGRGFWTDTWNPVLQLDPEFFRAYMRFSSLPARRNVLEPKLRELIYCAFDASTTHLYGRGTKIHMRNAIRLGATPEEVMEMLELVFFVGMNGVVNGASILAQETHSSRTNGVGEAAEQLNRDDTNCKDNATPRRRASKRLRMELSPATQPQPVT